MVYRVLKYSLFNFIIFLSVSLFFVGFYSYLILKDLNLDYTCCKLFLVFSFLNLRISITFTVDDIVKWNMKSLFLLICKSTLSNK